MIKFNCQKCGCEVERYHDETENNHFCNEHLGGDGTMNKCRLCKNEEVKDHDYMSLATFFEDIDMVPDIYLCRSCLKRLIRRMTEFIQLITDNN